MYKIRIKGIENKYEFDELIKVFLQPDSYDLYLGEKESPEKSRKLSQFPQEEETVYESEIVINEGGNGAKDDIKREIFEKLSLLTGKKPDWGILTGVRPVKLAGEVLDKLGSRDEAKKRFEDFYYLSPEKAELIIDTCEYQRKILGKPPENSLGLYIGIPFCPTRCVYCSFASNQVGASEIERYMTALHKEIDAVGDMMAGKNIVPESIYIGGGTPTTLTEEQLSELLRHIRAAFPMDKVKEFTVEAGRPDTITEGKLLAIKEYGAGRISINPQSMKQRTLELIGRAHTPEDTWRAFEIAKKVEIPVINADLIAGLPEENEADFIDSLKKMIVVGAQNITVHTLAVKRASRLIEQDKDFHYKQADIVRNMLAAAREILIGAAYRPYYLYRQKHMAGSFENIGWCKGDTAGIYNIRIMEEAQSIVALGAGGISKAYYPEENRLERVANVTNYEIYISRIDEMIERKERNLF